jgi:anhydro-N-acetylmuramic acid kinase
MKLIGLMSGTSLDGVDAVLVQFRGDPPARPYWRVLAAVTVPYDEDVRDRIRGALAPGPPRDLCLLHRELGLRFTEAVGRVLEEAGCSVDEVVAVASHGQTIWHEPPDPSGKGGLGATLQLGDAATLAEETGIPVVSDFRSRDVAAGGQGAPLVPWADALLFTPASGTLAIQNLGGMANVTVLGGDEILAFDTGPGMALIDAAAARATRGALPFDVDGKLAAAGTVDEALVEGILEHPFFKQAPPRSTGRETFGEAFVENLVTGGGPMRPEDWPDLVATLTELTARSIARAYRDWVLPAVPSLDRVLVMGGGARNPTLVSRIAEALAPIPVEVPDEGVLGVDPDFREALCFAALGWAFLQGVPGNVPSVTGAAGPRVLGSFTPGREES